MSKPLDFEEDAASSTAPAMGERIARWGLGYQDKVATHRLLELLREDAREGSERLLAVRLADLEAGRVDDFVIDLDTQMDGYSIKSTLSSDEMNWGDLIGSQGLIKELAGGWLRLCHKWPDKQIVVRLVTNKTASTAKHHAQLIKSLSVSEFFRNHWGNGALETDSPELADIWHAIASHTTLSPNEFGAFTKAAKLEFGVVQPPYVAGDNLDEQMYLEQFDRLHKAIATWIANNPKEATFSRRFLLEAIGVSGKLTGLVQVFPSPQIAYAKNQSSSERIRLAIENIGGGYLAVVGPAGIGKSTLVQDVLSDCPTFLPYFAYLPDGIGNPRERGDAATFFRDVVARLDRHFDGRHALGVKDVAQGKQAFREHMKRANELFMSTGQKTILLIDGLDHIQRESGLSCSLLQELPVPIEIPDGFIIVLSSQPQTLTPGVIERHVAAAVAPNSRSRIEIEGLSRDEVHEITAHTDSSIEHEDRDIVWRACQGNPLILTYLLKFRAANPDISVSDVVKAIGEYSGDIDAYYQSALSVVLQDRSARRVLSLISRAVVPIPIPWLQSWPERGDVEDVYAKHIRPFVRIENRQLHFIHNSFLVFLRSNTQSNMPGIDRDHDEREIHRELAERCATARCSDRIGRAKVHHLYNSGQKAELLAVLSSEWFRDGIEAFVPHAELRPLLLQGFACAWELGRYGEVLRLILLDFELGQRSNRIDVGDLAQNFLLLAKPELATTQIRSSGKILLEEKEAFEAAANLFYYDLEHNDATVSQLAREVYLQAKPLNYLFRAEPIDRHMGQVALQEIERWVGAAPLFEKPVLVCKQIMNLRFAPTQGDWEEPEASTKARLVRIALLTAIANGSSYPDLLPYLCTLVRLRSGRLLFASLLSVYRAEPSARIFRALRRWHTKIDCDQDLELLFAEILLREGAEQEAADLCKALERVPIDEFRHHHSFGFSGVSYNVRLARLQNILNIDGQVDPPVDAAEQEPPARIMRTCREIGVLLGRAWNYDVPTDLKNDFRSALLFQNRSVSSYPIDVHGRIALSRVSDSVFSQLITASKLFQEEGVVELRRAFLEILEGPAADQFNPTQRRRFALHFAESGAMGPDEASLIGLSLENDVTDNDPSVRVQACFDIAIFLSRLGLADEAEKWISRASSTSAGAGDHKDYHMWHLAEWITRACDQEPGDLAIEALQQFLRSNQVAGGDGAWRACSTVLSYLIGARPDRAYRLAVEFVDKDMLSVGNCLSALLQGAASHSASSSLLGSLYSNLLLLLQPADSAEPAEILLRHVAPEKQVDLALRMAAAVRTNAAPDRRASILRTMQDTLCEMGRTEVRLDAEFLSGRDDSAMKSALYRLATGELLTRAEVTRRLGDFSRQKDWNPNPSENEEFSWESSLRNVIVSDVKHADALLAAFSFPHYAQVSLLAWKSGVYLKAGDRLTAEKYANEAIEEASGDGSWLEQLDGAKLRTAYASLIAVNQPRGLELARERFGQDLAAGKLWTTLLLSDIVKIFETLQVSWPSGEVLSLISAYLDRALAANRESEPLKALASAEASLSVDAALCRFAIHLLAFPVYEIALGARRSLGLFAVEEQDGATVLFDQRSVCDSVQLEHLLASIDCRADALPIDLRRSIESLNEEESIAVRSIAFRICAKNGWHWIELRDQQPTIRIILPQSDAADSDDDSLSPYSVAAVAAHAAPRIFKALNNEGHTWQETTAELLRLYGQVEAGYQWNGPGKLAQWVSSVNSAFWLNVRAVVGREAAMRLFGLYVRSGLVPSGAEGAYDAFHPIYDPSLELLSPKEMPAEFGASDWVEDDADRTSWAAGKQADSWRSYPEKIDDLVIVGERTMLTRPVWDWPREERFRGLSTAPISEATTKESFSSTRQLTHEMYIDGFAQRDDQLVIWNNEQQLLGSTYSWIAFNANAARQMGWVPSKTEPFRWEDANGVLMVKSIFWRNGWIGLKPPHLFQLGQGWIVVASDIAVQTIKNTFPKCSRQLWISRDQQGRNACSRRWHLESGFPV